MAERALFSEASMGDFLDRAEALIKQRVDRATGPELEGDIAGVVKRAISDQVRAVPTLHDRPVVIVWLLSPSLVGSCRRNALVLEP